MKMAQFTFRGLMAPTFTAFNADLSPNLEIIPEYAKFLADSKIKGVLVNGTSGEGMSMTVKERKQTAEAWIKAVQTTQQHVMVQVGGAPLPDVIELAKHAQASGANSLLCLPDLYFKPTTPSDLIRYLKHVGAAAPKLPLLYYHIPGFTNVNIHMGQFLAEMGDQIPNFHGIKFTSNALDEGMAALKAHNGRFAVFLGSDALMAGAYALGFDSAIATTLNFIPQFGVGILEEIQASNVEKARKIQDNLTEICATITKNGTWVPTMKAANNLVSSIKVGKAREPLNNLTDAHIQEIQAKISNIKL